MTRPDEKKIRPSDTLLNDYHVYEECVRDEMLQYIPEGVQTVLDVGCSIGNFGALLKSERGAEVWGVEPDEEAAAVASGRLDRVVCGSFDSSLDLGEKRFDCIVFNDVLEHLVDPDNALRLAKGYLSKNATVVASIPNILFWPTMYKILRHQDWEYEDSAVMDRTHLRFFTKKSMVRMFVDCGYVVDRIEGINPFVMKRYQILNTILANHIVDWKFMQFAIVARNSGSS